MSAALKPGDYKHIAAWGAVMGSFAYYVQGQQARAAEVQAPVDAVFERHDANGPTGEWITYDGVSPESRAQVDFYLDKAAT